MISSSYKYRKHQKTKSEERADRVAELAERIGLPRAFFANPRYPILSGAIPLLPKPLPEDHAAGTAM